MKTAILWSFEGYWMLPLVCKI